MLIVAFMLSLCQNLWSQTEKPKRKEYADIKLTINITSKIYPETRLKIYSSNMPFSGTSYNISANSEGKIYEQNVVKGGTNMFSIPSTDSQMYFAIFLTGDYPYLRGLGSLENIYPIEAGRSITCEIDNNDYIFSGYKVEALNIQSKIAKTVFSPDAIEGTFMNLSNAFDYEGYFKLTEAYDANLLRMRLALVEANKNKISAEEAESLNAYCFGLDLSRATDYKTKLESWGNMERPNGKLSFYKALKQHLKSKTELSIKPKISPELLAKSTTYCARLLDEILLFERLKEESFSWKRSDDFFSKTIEHIKQNYIGAVKDKLFAEMSIRFNSKSNFNNHLAELAMFVSDEKYRALIIDKAQKSTKGFPFRPFKLKNENGDDMTLENFKNKVVVLDYWYTGCINCVSATAAIRPTYERYSKNKDVVFATVCIDKDRNQWLKSIKGQKYTHSGYLNLYTNGQGADNDLIKYYNIIGYPRLMMFKNGKLISSNVPSPTTDKGEAVEKMIEEALASN